jgi:tetratricopeptide (TPR) repeat protein
VTEACAHVEETLALADGELAGAAAERVRGHLADCEECQRELAEAMQLAALPPPVRVAAPVAKDPAPAPAPVVSIDRARTRRRTTRIVVGVAVATAAAAAVILWVRRPTSGGGSGGKGPVVAVALAPRRGIEARLAWDQAAAYRPYDVDRGTGAREAIPLATLAALEKAADEHGLGAVSILAGDLDRATDYLAAGGKTADLESDRAALALARGDAEAALTLAASALELDPTHPAARWNHALALRDLGLVRSAAEAFAAIAASTDPRDAGWTAEAKTRADALTADADARSGVIERVLSGSRDLVQTGAGISVEDARAAPGYTRIHLYDALRAAPDRERVLGLRPLAEAIDAATGGTGTVAAVDRVAAADFAKRAPLAATYAAIAAGQRLSPEMRAAYLADLRAARQPDMLIGALLKLSASRVVMDAADVPAGAAAAAELGDAWSELQVVEYDVQRRIEAFDYPGAEALLASARDRCARANVPYRCVKLAALQGTLLLEQNRFADARAAIATAWADARITGDSWLLERDLLPRLAELHASRSDLDPAGQALVRAYTHERELRTPTDKLCAVQAWGHELVATTLVNQLRIADARRELAIPRCADRPPNTNLMLMRAHIARTDGTSAERDALLADIAALRADSTSPGDLAVLDHSAGRALIDVDRARAEKLLRSAIAIADAAPKVDVDARKARAYSYVLLELDAAKRGEAEAALAALGEEAGLSAGPCTLGLALDDDRWLAAARGADGRAVVSYAEDRTVGVVPTRLPSAVLDPLAGCQVIDVIARAPFEGHPALLPADRAWRFRSARRVPLAAVRATPRRLIVADPQPPAALGLPLLAPWRDVTDGELVTGPAATPARVLAAARDATWIEVHAHGVASPGLSDAAYLALSPGSDGRYALTAADLRRVELRGAPVVVLAACRAADGTDLSDEPWGLPEAFVDAGARAVLASDAPIPDAAAAAVFADFRARIDRGEAPAIALRDVRVAWAGRAGGWLSHLMLFE